MSRTRAIVALFAAAAATALAVLVNPRLGAVGIVAAAIGVLAYVAFRVL